MPADYIACRDSYVKKGVSMKTAKARCAAWFYKKNGMTVNEAHKKGEATAESPMPPELVGEDLTDIDFDLVALMLKDLPAIDELANTQPSESTKPAKGTTDAISEVVAINKEFLADSNIVEIVATKVGAKAFTGDGRAVVWTPKALEKAQATWVLGRVSMNHEDNNHGRIIASFMDGDLLRMVVKVSDTLKDWILKASDLIGVSIEAINVKVNKAFEIMTARGTGVTFVFPPHEPACTIKEGCGIVATETTISNPPDLTLTSTTPDDTFLSIPYIHTDWNLIWTTTTNGTAISDAPINIVEKDKILDTPEKGEHMAEETKEQPKTICAEKHDRLMKEKDDTVAALNVEIVSLKATVTKFEDEKRVALLDSLKSEGVDSEPYKTETIPVIEKVIAAVKAFKKKEEDKPEVNSGAVVIATAETKTEPKGNIMSATVDEAAEKARLAAEADTKKLNEIFEKAKKFGY